MLSQQDLFRPYKGTERVEAAHHRVGEGRAHWTSGPGRRITWALESWTRQSCSWILWSSSCCHRMLACRTRVRCSSWSLMVWNTLNCAGNYKVESEIQPDESHSCLAHRCCSALCGLPTFTPIPSPPFSVPLWSDPKLVSCGSGLGIPGVPVSLSRAHQNLWAEFTTPESGRVTESPHVFVSNACRLIFQI